VRGRRAVRGAPRSRSRRRVQGLRAGEQRHLDGGKEALRAYWTAALTRIDSLAFTLDYTLWDPARRQLAIIYTAAINGQTKRVSENLRFDEHDRVIAGEVFHGVVDQVNA
jgi:hypothetical protein